MRKSGWYVLQIVAGAREGLKTHQDRFITDITKDLGPINGDDDAHNTLTFRRHR